MKEEEQTVYTLAEVAELLRVSERTIRRLVERGELTAAQVGASWRFTRTDLNAYLRKQGSKGLDDN